MQPGADASAPACTPPQRSTRTTLLAAPPAFVVIGDDDGLPGTVSACIERELRWAGTATSGPSDPRFADSVIAAAPWTKRELPTP